MNMEALDLMKKNWQKDAYVSNQFSEKDIYKMLQKKSSSIVRWIFIISLIEFGLGIIISIILSFTNLNSESDNFLKKYGLYEANLVLTVLIYIVVVFFIFNFYKMYKKISTESNTKDLIQSVLKTRKVVKQYIAFNLITFAIIMVVAAGYGFFIGYAAAAVKHGGTAQIPPLAIVIGFIVIVILTAILTVIAWLIYKVLYGILLKKLNKNHEELKKLDF